jgi:hypothetical protein
LYWVLLGVHVPDESQTLDVWAKRFQIWHHWVLSGLNLEFAVVPWGLMKLSGNQTSQNIGLTWIMFVALAITGNVLGSFGYPWYTEISSN